MKKSVVVAGFLIAGSVGAVFLLANLDPGNSQPAVIANLQAMKTEPTAAPVPPKKSEDDFPIPKEIGPWPKVVANELTYSFGRMQVGETKSHPFVIRNEGDADLLLKAGTTTCKCTQFDFDAAKEVDLKEAVVKPGDSITLTMSWKAGEHPDRLFRHGGDVFTNDPKQTVIKYAVEGAIEMPFEILPQVWSIGEMFDGQPGKLKAAVASRIHDNIEIESVHSPSGMVNVKWTPMSPEDRASNRYSSGLALDVEVSADIPSGIFKEELEIRLSQQQEPIMVSLTARKHGALRIQQMPGTSLNLGKMQIQLGSFAASEGREAKLLVIVDEKGMTEPLQITEVEADPSFMTARLSPMGDPTGTVHRYVLTLTVPPNRPHMQRVESKPGFIHLSTNHPSGEAIKFEVLLYSN